MHLVSGSFGCALALQTEEHSLISTNITTPLQSAAHACLRKIKKTKLASSGMFVWMRKFACVSAIACLCALAPPNTCSPHNQCISVCVCVPSPTVMGMSIGTAGA